MSSLQRTMHYIHYNRRRGYCWGWAYAIGNGLFIFIYIFLIYFYLGTLISMVLIAKSVLRCEALSALPLRNVDLL